MFQKIYQKLQTREGFMLVASVAIIVVVIGGIFGKIGFHHNSENYKDQEATITVSGNGEMNVSPDVATFTATVSQEAKTMAEAQKKSAEQEKALVEKLILAGILEKDIKTESFNAYPKYENQEFSSRICSPTYCPPSNTNPVIVGYTVSHTYSIKVRDLDTVSAIAQVMTDANISMVSGPNFVVDDVIAVKNEARDKAIADAQIQAKILAKQLDVRLGDIVDFQVVDNQGGYPLYDARMVSAMGSAEKSVSPSIMPGETKITSQVMITYQIR